MSEAIAAVAHCAREFLEWAVTTVIASRKGEPNWNTNCKPRYAFTILGSETGLGRGEMCTIDIAHARVAALRVERQHVRQ